MNSDESKARWFAIRRVFYNYFFIGLVFGLGSLVFSFFQHGKYAVFVRWMSLFTVLFMGLLGILYAAWWWWKTRRNGVASGRF